MVYSSSELFSRFRSYDKGHKRVVGESRQKGFDMQVGRSEWSGMGVSHGGLSNPPPFAEKVSQVETKTMVLPFFVPVAHRMQPDVAFW